MKNFILTLPLLVSVSFCQSAQLATSETEQALCEAWGSVIFKPSQNDTIETARLAQTANNKYKDICI